MPALSTKSSQADDASTPLHASWLPDVAILSVAVIWGVNIPLMKIGLGQLDNVFIFNAVRLPISAAALAVFAWREWRAGIRPKPGITWRHLIVYSLMVSVSYQLTFLLGVNMTTPGNTALIIATVPMWTALLASFFLKERLRGLAWCGLAVALLGTIIVAVQKGVSADSRHLLGNLAILVAALLWAAGTVYSRPLFDRISVIQLSVIVSTMALPVHILVAAYNYTGDLSALRSIPLWCIIIYSGVLSSGLTQPMWHFGVKYAGTAHAAIVQNLIPLIAILAAWVISGDTPTGAQVCGGILIIGGLVLMRSSRTVASKQPGIRQLKAEDAPTASHLAIASKAHWGYGEDQMRVFSKELTLSPDQLQDQLGFGIWEGDSLRGFYTLATRDQGVELEHLFVAPDSLRCGLGRQLMSHAKAQAKQIGASRMTILSDPHSAGFYERMGARLDKWVPSSIPGRDIPVFRLDVH